MMAAHRDHVTVTHTVDSFVVSPLILFVSPKMVKILLSVRNWDGKCWYVDWCPDELDYQSTIYAFLICPIVHVHSYKLSWAI